MRMGRWKARTSVLGLIAICTTLVVAVATASTITVSAGGDSGASIAKKKHKKKKKKHPPPLPPAPPSPPPPPPPLPPTVQVTYTARDCFRDSAGQTPPGVEVPLDSARIRLVPGQGSPIS